MSYDNDPHAGRSVGLYMGLSLTETGDWERGEIEVTGRTTDIDHLRGPDGGVRAGAVFTMVDNVAGFCAGLGTLPDGWVVSTNLQVRIHGRIETARLVSRVLRKGRRAIVTGCEAFDESGVLVADGILTSAVLVPEFGVPVWERPAAIVAPPHPSDPAPLLDSFGIADDALFPSEQVRNPWGIVHGGVLATMVDVAAERAASRFAGTQMATTDAVLHYLAPARVGPIRAHTKVIGPQGEGWLVRVELRDEGSNDRVTTAAVCSTRPA